MCSQKWGKGCAGAEASMTTASVIGCAIAGRFTTIALAEHRRSAKKRCSLRMKVLTKTGPSGSLGSGVPLGELRKVRK